MASEIDSSSVTSDSSQPAKKDKVDDEESLATPMDCFKSKAACSSCCCGLNNYYKALIFAAVVFAYLLLGGLFFLALERPNEQATAERRQLERMEATEALREFENSFDQFLVNFTSMSMSEAREQRTMLVELAVRVAAVNQTIRAETDPIWDYASSVFFASTVITTIGYGTIAPTTAGGQLLFIFYALLGIPLALIFLSIIGSILSTWLAAAVMPLVKRCSKNKVLARGISTLVVVIATLVFFIIIPAAIFYALERPNEWSYLNSVYYCFVTLTTVGFGDYVPGIEGSSISDNPALIGIYRIVTAVWVWIGLALVATLISEVQELIEAFGKYVYRRKNKKKNSFSMDSVVGDSEQPAAQAAEKTPVLSQEEQTAENQGDV